MSELKCKACGKTWSKHPGVQEMCHRVEASKVELGKRDGKIQKMEAEIERLSTDLSRLVKVVRERYKK